MKIKIVGNWLSATQAFINGVDVSDSILEISSEVSCGTNVVTIKCIPDTFEIIKEDTAQASGKATVEIDSDKILQGMLNNKHGANR